MWRVPRRAAMLMLATAVSANPTGFVTLPQADAHRSLADATSVSVSEDGRFVAFTSFARLVPADVDRCRDIYIFDRTTSRVSLESEPQERCEEDGDADHPRLSGDGRMLVYQLSGQILLRDRRTGSARTLGDGDAPAISADGNAVTFVAKASPAGADQIRVVNVSTGAVARVHPGTDAEHFTGAYADPSLSRDGRVVAFAAIAAGAGPPENHSRRPFWHVYAGHVADSSAVRLSGMQARAADGDSWQPAISGDGRIVAFTSTATNLVEGDQNRTADVFAVDVGTGAIELLSRNMKRVTANGRSSHPAVSVDGRFVVFQSDASDLVCASRCRTADEDINLLTDVFVVDRQTKIVRRVSADSGGEWMEASGGPAIDGAGRVIAFSSRHATGAADTSNDFDLYIASQRLPAAALPSGASCLACSRFLLTFSSFGTSSSARSKYGIASVTRPPVASVDPRLF
jgi:Tol biopolymer transport system component